jgi:hypothetical protein
MVSVTTSLDGIRREDFKEKVLEAKEKDLFVIYVTDNHCVKHAEELLGIKVQLEGPPEESEEKVALYSILWDKNKGQCVYREYITE